MSSHEIKKLNKQVKQESNVYTGDYDFGSTPLPFDQDNKSQSSSYMKKEDFGKSWDQVKQEFSVSTKPGNNWNQTKPDVPKSLLAKSEKNCNQIKQNKVCENQSTTMFGEEDEGLLTCLVCHNEFEGYTPGRRCIVLPCGHSLCKVCYDRVVDRLNYSVKCSKCKLLHTGITDMDQIDERQGTGSATSSTVTATLVSAETTALNISSDAIQQAFLSGGSSSCHQSTPFELYQMPPALVCPKPSCVRSDIKSYITCATREYEGEMIELSFFYYGKDITWHINNKTFSHPSGVSAVSLTTALTDLKSWLSNHEITKPLLIVGHTDFQCLLKSMEIVNKSIDFKPYIEGFTDTQKNIFKVKGKEKAPLKDVAINKLGMFNTEKENDTRACAATLTLIIETEIEEKGRYEMLERLAKHSREFDNALEYSRFMSKVEENLNCQFENTCLKTLMKRSMLRKDVGRKIAEVGLTYKDICMIYRLYGEDMIHMVFKITRKITDSQKRVEEVIRVLKK